MLDLSIRSNWILDRKTDDQTLVHLVRLLVAMHECASLAEATRQSQVSYRNSWALLKKGELMFGAPLAVMQRGRGAALTPLGEKLVWAQHRVDARLAPIFANLASEIGNEIAGVLSAQHHALRIHASHGFAVETLCDMLAQAVEFELQYRGSLASVVSLANGNCDIAGFHVPIGEFEAPILERYAALLRRGPDRVIRLATRRQGLIVRKDCAGSITSLQDLTRSGVRFVNRGLTSGTRMLFDLMLQRERIDARAIYGYESIEDTHAAVAAVVASGMADACFGMERPARRFGLHFIPMVNENGFLLTPAKSLVQPAVRTLLQVLTGSAFRALVNALPGYDASRSGEILSLPEAFATWDKVTRVRQVEPHRSAPTLRARSSAPSIS